MNLTGGGRLGLSLSVVCFEICFYILMSSDGRNQIAIRCNHDLNRGWRLNSKSSRFDSADGRFDSDLIQTYSNISKKLNIWFQVPIILDSNTFLLHFSGSVLITESVRLSAVSAVQWLWVTDRKQAMSTVHPPYYPSLTKYLILS